MNMTRCSNGHFYDADKYSSCPHCQGGGADVTAPYTAPAGGSVDMSRTMDSTLSYRDSAFATDTVSSIPSDQGVTEYYQGGSAFGNVNVGGFSMPDDMGVTGPANMASGAGSYDQWGGDPATRATGPVEEVGATQRFKPSDNIKGEPTVGWLVCISGSHAGESYTLRTGKNFIGRGSDMDVVLKGDASVSRNKHAILLYEPKNHTFLVQPGESRELFYLNGEVVLSIKEIKAYDRMQVGQTDLIFVPLCGENFSWDELADSDDK